MAIDLIILEIFYILLALLFAVVFLQGFPADPVLIISLSAVYIFASFPFLHMAYFTFFHAWSGQTIGKMFMGIKVVTRGHSIASPPVAFLRWAGYIVSLVPLAAGFLWAAVDREHCAWHDWLSQTRVIPTEIS